jgi:hypothetical protein
MAKFSLFFYFFFFLSKQTTKKNPQKRYLNTVCYLSGKTSLRDLEIGAANLPNIV